MFGGSSKGQKEGFGIIAHGKARTLKRLLLDNLDAADDRELLHFLIGNVDDADDGERETAEGDDSAHDAAEHRNV